MRVSFLPAARTEMAEAFEWYQQRSPALGAAFLAAADRLVHRIVENPLAFPAMTADVRRARFRRFPSACSSANLRMRFS
jgi:hypothetical protein